MAITSVGYDGTVNEAQWAALAPGLGVHETVEYGLDATVVITPDRAVRISAGAATAYGVRAVSDANETVSLAAGSRWDTIVLRRNWQAAPSGITTLAVVQGNSNRAIAAGIEDTPGVITDQPLYLARVVSGSSVVSELVDVRTYASKVLAVPSLTAVPSAPVGTVVISGGRLLQRRANAGGTPVWAPVGEGEWLSYVPYWRATVTNPGMGNSSRVGRYTRIGDTVHFTLTMTTGSTFSRGSGTYMFGLPFPPNPNIPEQIATVHVGAVGIDEITGTAKLDPGSGDIFRVYLDLNLNGATRARRMSHDMPTLATGSRVHITGTYYAAPLAPV